VDDGALPPSVKQGGTALPLARALARIAGWLVLALSLGFLGRSLWLSAPWPLAAARGAELALAIGAGTLAYGLAGFLLAEAWRQLLGPGAPAARRRDYHALYGRTQIAKYLPGNCFHFVGRQLLGRRLGHGHGALALASLAETALLLAVAGLLSLPLLAPELAHALGEVPVWPAGAMALAAVGLIVAIVRPGAAAALRMLGLLRSWAPRLAAAGLLHLAFFAVGGLILWMLGAAARAPGAQAIDLPAAVAVLALGWWVGLVVPGAAAGVGVREAVLMLTLQPHLGADAALLVALALRVITTLGDLLFFGLSCLAPAHLGNEAVAIRSRS
jgi:glycosyltransferase 2 family protein